MDNNQDPDTNQDPFTFSCMCIEELESKARKIGTSNRGTVCAGNSIVIFAMFLLQEILEHLALNPITNLTSIIAVSGAIASLNSSINIDP